MHPQLSEAARRNTGPIGDILDTLLSPGKTVLMIAEGTGTHVVGFSQRFTDMIFQPTDPDPSALASIEAHRALAGNANFLPPRRLDVTELPWAGVQADLITCINMIHISPFEATKALFAGASGVLGSGSALLTYGPYFQEGVDTAPSNLAFDQSLRARNPAWGIRSVTEVAEVAEDAGFSLADIHEMPANNLTLLWQRI